MSVRIAFGVAAGVGLIAFLMQRELRGVRIEAGAGREEFYGASGQCFKQSDNTEVPAERCTERGISVGLFPGVATDAENAAAGAVAGVGGFLGSIGGFFK